MIHPTAARTTPRPRQNWLFPALCIGLILAAILVIALVLNSTRNSAGVPAAASATVHSGVAREPVREAPVLGVVVDSKMRVLHVEAGGAAEGVGIRAGDVLVSLGGTALTEPGAGKSLIWQALRSAPSSSVALPVVLTRNGQPLTVTAQLKPPKRWSGMPTPTAVPYDEYYF